MCACLFVNNSYAYFKVKGWGDFMCDTMLNFNELAMLTVVTGCEIAG